MDKKIIFIIAVIQAMFIISWFKKSSPANVDTSGINTENTDYLKIKPLTEMKDSVMGIDGAYGVNYELKIPFDQQKFDDYWKESGLKWIRKGSNLQIRDALRFDAEGNVMGYDWSKADTFYHKGIDNGWKMFVVTMLSDEYFKPSCEPKQFKGKWNDHLVVYVDENTPLNPGCTEKDRAVAIKRWQTYANAIEEFSRHYKDIITYYELFNEPDGTNPAGTIGYWPFSKTIPNQKHHEEYGYTAKGLSQAIKRGNPDAKIMVGSLSLTIPKLEWLQNTLSIIGSQNYDIFSYHPYRYQDGCQSRPYVVSPEKPVGYYRPGKESSYPYGASFEDELETLYKIASMNGKKPNVEIWDTESGFVYYPLCPKEGEPRDSGGPYTTEFFNQAKWFTRHFMMLFGTNPWIKKWFIFHGSAEPALANECWRDYRSLLTQGNPPTKRLGYYTASYLASIFETDNLKPAGLKIQFENTNTPGFKNSPRAVSLLKDGKDIFIGYWLPEDMDDKFKTPGKTDLVVNKVFFQPVLIYLADDPNIPPGQPNSKWAAVVPITEFSVSSTSTTFRNLPITDYAYLIAEAGCCLGEGGSNTVNLCEK